MAANAEAEPGLSAYAHPVAISALGRLQPKDGIFYVAGPSQATAVIAKLLVNKGDVVEEGQVIAVLDTLETRKADLERVRVELEHAEEEYRRLDSLYHRAVASASERDAWDMKVKMLRAEMQHASVELDQASVRAPIRGTVLDVHARSGEKVAASGIAELAKTDQMYAIAEVYETDIGRVHVGQRATVQSPALAQSLHGSVERIGMKIGKQDVLGLDPLAATDTRVVEVEIRLDDSKPAAALTNLEVQVTITP